MKDYKYKTVIPMDKGQKAFNVAIDKLIKEIKIRRKQLKVKAVTR